MRIAQFDLPGKDASGAPVQCAVFGGIGGGKQPNIDRWIGQLQQADGSDSKSKAKITETTRDGMVITRIELVGTFSGGMMPGQAAGAVPDALLLGAIVEAVNDPSQSIYIKLVGPKSVVEPETAVFDALLASLRPRSAAPGGGK
jgi:hypothetical protein